MARPTKLTPELTEKICDKLRGGNFVETVCDSVGIHKDTFYEWLRRGDRAWQTDIHPVNYVEFSDAVKKAVSDVEMGTLAELREGPQNWQAKAWWLERRHPDKWGNRGKQQIEHSGHVGMTVQDWRKQQQKNRQQAAETLGDFDDATE